MQIYRQSNQFQPINLEAIFKAYAKRFQTHIHFWGRKSNRNNKFVTRKSSRK
jgi:hypothetical protein